MSAAMNFDSLYELARPVLFRFDAEEAHHLTLAGLRFAEKTGLTHLLNPGVPASPVSCMGLEFSNAVGLAAGLDKAGQCVDGFGAMGFGHVEVGTITPRPQPGNPAPRLFRLHEKNAVINRMGFNNPGLDQALKNIATRQWKGLLGFNIGKNFDTPNERAADDYLACFRGAAGRVDYVTVNISSPNTKGLRDLQQEGAIRTLLHSLKEEQDRQGQLHSRLTPIAVKIAPDLDTEALKAIAGVLTSEKMDAVIATNTTLSREGVSHLVESGERGGLSGGPLTRASTEIIRQLHRELGPDLPIIGAGGILTGADAVEKLNAGARLVQIYTGLIYRGPALIREILEATGK